MNIQTIILLVFTHVTIGAFGFAIGIYSLPILIAPSSTSVIEIEGMSLQAVHR